MYISLNWIKEFVDLDGIDIKEIENKFTLGTAEIEGVEEKGKNIKNVVVGKIISVEAKEDLKTTRVVKVDVGNGKVVQTCCGAPNAKEGMYVPCALEGGSIVGLDKISARKTGGYESNCILCSEKELGISDNHEGLMELNSDLKIGTDIKEVLDIDDIIIEVDNKSLTNRPDLWGHYGIARELAAIFKKPLKKLEVEKIENDPKLPKLDITIENEKCNRYTGLTISNVKEKDATKKMQIRLYYCGMRSISLLVDLTNYIMMEIGQPMHAFDKRDMDKIVVSSAKGGTKFVTLDDEEREIPEGTMMICNSKGPVAIAGIMGGANTEIKDDTTELLLESANFDAGNIRKSAVKLRLRTDASARYEKSLDPELTTLCIERFIKLLKDVQDDIKITSNLTDVYKNKSKEIVIEITRDFINNMAGINYSDEFIIDCLQRLEFEVTQKDGKYLVKVPSFRATKDISMESDLVEEVSRIFGYDNIVPTPISLPIEPVVFNPIKDLNDKIKEVLTDKYNANETHSYVWYDNDFCKEIGINPSSELNIINSEDGYATKLRTTMIPTMLKAASINLKNYDDFKCYEIGNVFHLDKDKLSNEKAKLAIVLASKSKSTQDIFYELRDMVNNIVRITKGYEIKCVEASEVDEASNESIACDIEVSGNIIGRLFAVKDNIAKKIHQKSKIVLCEIDIESLLEIKERKITYKAPSIYQDTKLDFNFLISKTVLFDDVVSYMNEFKSKLRYEIKLIDVYEGKGIDDDKRSMTFNVIIGSDERTLTSDEITEFHDSFIKHMEQKGYVLR